MPDQQRNRAALYARFSSDLQNDRSIADQFAVCQTYAHRQGLTVTHRFEDRAKSSATLFGRTGLLDMVSRAKAGEFDVIVVEALDRISRNAADLHHLFQTLDFQGIRIEEVHRGRADAMVIGINGLVGQMFLKGLAEKTWRGHAGKVRTGQRAGGKAYGYECIPGKPGELVILEHEAEIVRRIFREYADGQSTRQIAKGLNAEGIPSPRGSVWRASALTGNVKRHYGLLLNDLYRGEIIWNRVKMVRNPDTGKRVNRSNPPEDWHRTEAPHLRIIPEDLWQAVQRRRIGANGGPRPQQRRPRIFTGLLSCAHCGGNVTVRSTGKDGRCYAHCATAAEAGTCDATGTFRLDKIESEILHQLRRTLDHPEYIAIYVEEYHAERQRLAAAKSKNRHSLERAAARARAKFDRAHRLYIDGVTDGEVARQTLKDLRLAAEAAERDLSDSTETPEPITLHPTAPRRYLDALTALQPYLTNPTTPEARKASTILRELVNEIRITRGSDGSTTADLTGYLSAFTGQQMLCEGGGVTSLPSPNNGQVPLCRVRLIAG